MVASSRCAGGGQGARRLRGTLCNGVGRRLCAPHVNSTGAEKKQRESRRCERGVLATCASGGLPSSGANCTEWAVKKSEWIDSSLCPAGVELKPLHATQYAISILLIRSDVPPFLTFLHFLRGPWRVHDAFRVVPASLPLVRRRPLIGVNRSDPRVLNMRRTHCTRY